MADRANGNAVNSRGLAANRSPWLAACSGAYASRLHVPSSENTPTLALLSMTYPLQAFLWRLCSWIATVAEAGVKVGQTFLSAHVAEEALSAVSGTGRRQAEDASAQMCLLCFCLQDNRKDGRFFAALRMTCIAIAIAEMFRSYLRQTCHPEEAARPTKDLLRHRIITARLVRVDTWQAARPHTSGSLRMTVELITTRAMFPSHLRLQREEADVRVGQTFLSVPKTGSLRYVRWAVNRRLRSHP